MEHAEDNRALTRAIIATQFAPPFMVSGVAVILPAMGTDLGAGATSLGLIETLFLASQLGFLLTAGRLADAADKRSVFKAGVACFALCSFLIAFLSSVPAILFLRVLQGMSAAAFAATGPAILSEIVPPERRGRAFGSSIGAVYAGLTLGPVVAGVASDLLGWRSVFIIGGAAVAAGCALIFSMMKSKWTPPAPNAVNVPSALLLATAALTLVAGSATLREGLIGYGCFATALVLIAGFVRLQYGLAQPLLDVRALTANHVLRGAVLVQFLLYVTAFAMNFLASLYMQVLLGTSASLTGWIIAISTLLMAVMAPVSGKLSDRFRPERVIYIGVSFMLASVIMGVLLDGGTGLIFITVMLSIQGLGFAFFSTPNMTIIMGAVPRTATGMASALGAKARAMGMMSGMLIVTLLISLDFGNSPIHDHPDRLVGTIMTSFAILAAITAAAFVLAVWPQKKNAS